MLMLLLFSRWYIESSTYAFMYTWNKKSFQIIFFFISFSRSLSHLNLLYLSFVLLTHLFTFISRGEFNDDIISTVPSFLSYTHIYKKIRRRRRKVDNKNIYKHERVREWYRTKESIVKWKNIIKDIRLWSREK